ncbi:hypothetical protein [Streptomyces sp. NPDC054784]
MFCPHCDKSLQRTDRSGSRCRHCKREFALEPKENSLNLHDVRVGKLVRKLGDGRELRYTHAQLWYAAVRNRVPDPGARFDACAVLAFLVVVLSVVFGGVVGTARAILLAVLVGGALVTALVIGMIRLSRRARERDPRQTPMSLDLFRDVVLRRWSAVYGGPPQGLVDEREVALPAVPGARAALVCPDRAVLACLALNGAAERHGLALVHARGAPDPAGRAEWTGLIPDGVPVVVLHDASPQGLEFAAGTRAAYGPRAVESGLMPRAVLANESVLRLRQPPLPAPAVERLRSACGPMLTRAELDWLAGGWWAPLAAVTPAKLLTVVARAADRARERAEDLADPELGRARRTGFLTWPTA